MKYVLKIILTGFHYSRLAFILSFVLAAAISAQEPIDCHTDIKETPHAERLAPAACGACHEDAITELAESVHGKSEASADAPTCGDCHGSHEIRGRADSLSWVNPRQLGFTCARCHANPAICKNIIFRLKIHSKPTATACMAF